MQAVPYKGSLPTPVPTDPLIYRWYEVVSVYGTTIKELIHEEFGDGIMSAIDFKMDIVREADPKGDRVVVTLNGEIPRLTKPTRLLAQATHASSPRCVKGFAPMLLASPRAGARAAHFHGLQIVTASRIAQGGAHCHSHLERRIGDSASTGKAISHAFAHRPEKGICRRVEMDGNGPRLARLKDFGRRGSGKSAAQ